MNILASSKIMKIAILFLSVTAMINSSKAEEKPLIMNQIRTYISYSYPLDPGRIFTIGDMDFSYALASTLVQWDAKKQISGAVTSHWSNPDDHTYRFTIRSGLKWSNGESVTSMEIKSSFERAFKTYPDDLRSVIKLVKMINCIDSTTFDFVLTGPSKDAGLLAKLTEPQYGILKLKSNGQLNLSVTTGAFFVASDSPKAVTLKRSPYWFSYNNAVADEIAVKIPEPGYDHQRILLQDLWPNLAQTFSTLPKDADAKYKAEKFSIWTHSLDRLYLLSASKSLAENHRQALLQFLDKKLSRSSITQNLSGFTIADQVIPAGYPLHDPTYQPYQEFVDLPKEFKKRAVEILCPGSKLDAQQVQNVKSSLTEALGIEPHLQCIPLGEAGPRMAKGDYDLFMGSYGIADPDSEGLMSFYFEGDARAIPAAGNNFINRLDHARKEQNQTKRLNLMRTILSDAKNEGYILPLFHLSTVGIARPEIDLSQIPKTDESPTFSKIRFKKK